MGVLYFLLCEHSLLLQLLVYSLTPDQALGSLRAVSWVPVLVSGTGQMLSQCLLEEDMTVCVKEKGILFSIYVTEKIFKEMKYMLLPF